MSLKELPTPNQVYVEIDFEKSQANLDYVLNAEPDKK